jgi:hypothetical protein
MGTPVRVGHSSLGPSLPPCHAAKRVVFVPPTIMPNELHAAERHGLLDRLLRRRVRAKLLASMTSQSLQWAPRRPSSPSK